MAPIEEKRTPKKTHAVSNVRIGVDGVVVVLVVVVFSLSSAFLGFYATYPRPFQDFFLLVFHVFLVVLGVRIFPNVDPSASRRARYAQHRMLKRN